jgi:hypothetical protein
MGPVFVLAETAMNCTFIDFSIEAKCLDGSAPLHCCVVGSRESELGGIAPGATSPFNCC